MGVKNTYGSKARGDVLFFDPEDLVIVTDKANALYDERVEFEVDEKTVRNIMVNGVLQPVLGRRNGEKVEIVAGRQRVLAAREANKRLLKEGAEPVTVPVLWKRGDDATMLGIMISENEIRRDDTPMTKARKLQRLIDLGKSKKECAVLFGVSTVTVTNKLALLECAPQVQKAVESNVVSAEVAQTLSKLSHKEQVAKLDELIAAGTTKGLKGVRAAQQAVGKVVGLRVRSRKEMTAMLETMRETGENPDPKKLLRWCLGEDTLPKRLTGES
jgi:ParB family chromosome partitioning protein